MSERLVTPEVQDIPEFHASDKDRWNELRRMYLAHQIPGIIVRGLPFLSRASIFDLGNVDEFSTAETTVAINCEYVSRDGISQYEELGLHFDTGKILPNEATTNRVEVGRIGITLIECTSDFTAKWGSGYKRNPEIPVKAIEAHKEGLVDTTVFTPIAYTGEAGPYDALFSRNYGGNVLGHDIRSLTPSRLSFVQGVLLVA